MSVELLISLFTAVAVLVGGVWALIRVVVSQFEKRLDERFAGQEVLRLEGRKQWEERIARLEEKHTELERTFLKFLAELPREYQRREDHIRFELVINAKLDALAAKIELFGERQTRGQA